MEMLFFNNTNSQEWVGKTAYYDLTEKMAFSNHITVLKAKQNKILPQYLWIILNVYQQKRFSSLSVPIGIINRELVWNC